MADLRSLCVYCGSSDGGDPAYGEMAERLGRLAAERGVRIVYGGGRIGLMGRVSGGAKAASGDVFGIIPEHLMSMEIGDSGLTRLEVVESMHVRKARMVELSDAFCALPGGLGTLDETFEILTWRQLGLHDKPVILVNMAGYWEPLLDLIRHQARTGFVSDRHLGHFTVVDRVEDVFPAVAAAAPPRVPTDSRLL